MANTIYLSERENPQSRHEQFKIFAQEAGEFFDVSKAAALLKIPPSEATKVLSRWHKQGRILRITPGFYTLLPLNISTKNFNLEDPWLIIPPLFEPCYVGGVSALENFDLTEQLFHKLFVFTTRPVKKKEIKISSQVFILIHIQERQLFGLSPAWHGHTKIMISDIHRTMVDIFHNPEIGGGIQHAIDCLKNYLNKDEADLEKIKTYAEKLNNGAVFKRLGYLLSHYLGDSHPMVLAFQKHLAQGYVYLDPKQKKDVKLMTRWRLFVPKNLDLGDKA